MNNDEQNKRWHIDRSVSLPLLLALISQTIVLVWWLASLNATANNAVAANTRLEAKVDKLEAKVEALTNSVTTPVALIAARIETLNARVFTLETQMRELSSEQQAIKNEQARRTPYIPKKPQ